ncbi:SHOCT domain-containing protein [Gelidibacter maritimus]|uniref:SHOCT domain-containing protein n=1 Tax=Gelidibacter maritimus TaxID=2761487 RepID=A0A7W2R1Y6_9FLAO|nr:SHOCT domain-containing protein [Gelidibacter maritimus]MBA6151197.1 SHOCT domain-containing protein [Gelidibacter maritimus]
MKIIKIIVGLFCFVLTINTFKNGIPVYNNLALYAEFIPILIVFIIGIFLFKSALKPGVKTNVTLLSEDEVHLPNIEQIELKLKMLKEAYNDGFINEIEFEEKKVKFLTSKKSILSKNERASQFNLKKEKLTNLFENKIITKEEFNNKLIALKGKYQIDNFNIERIDVNSKLYYISGGNQYGPVSIGRIAYLIENNEVNKNCFVRFENESSFNKRANEIIKC